MLIPIFRTACIALLASLASSCAETQPPPTSATSSLPRKSSGQPRVIHLATGGAQIEIAIAPGDISVSDEAISKWVEGGAKALIAYFGKFPVSELTIHVAPGRESGIQDGLTTMAGISVKLGPSTRAADLQQDWIMTHEMFHLAFPDVDEEYHWLSEGRASYLEAMSRARIGVISAEKVWHDLMQGLPQGQPQPGDKGLDHIAELSDPDQTWGRTYWGGEMFCLLADLRIREQTGNRRSLDDAMRAILAQGGDYLHKWELQRILDVGDEATGTRVLHELHAEMGRQPLKVDLDALWKRLGVKARGSRVIFDDSAPLAIIRKSMTALP
jgi:hypothetical protein